MWDERNCEGGDCFTLSLWLIFIKYLIIVHFLHLFSAIFRLFWLLLYFNMYIKHILFSFFRSPSFPFHDIWSWLKIINFLSNSQNILKFSILTRRNFQCFKNSLLFVNRSNFTKYFYILRTLFDNLFLIYFCLWFENTERITYFVLFCV